MHQVLVRATKQYEARHKGDGRIHAVVPEWPRNASGEPTKIMFRTVLSVRDMEFLARHEPHVNPEHKVSSIPFIADVFMLTALDAQGNPLVPEEDRETFYERVDALLCAAIITRCGAYPIIMGETNRREEPDLGKPSAS